MSRPLLHAEERRPLAGWSAGVSPARRPEAGGPAAETAALLGFVQSGAPYTIFGIIAHVNIVRFSRLRAGFTQQELAKRAGISQPALARIESGRVIPRLDTIERLLRAAGMSLEPLPRAGTGVDRSTIRKMLELSPRRRLDLAAREARNLQAMKPRR